MDRQPDSPVPPAVVRSSVAENRLERALQHLLNFPSGQEVLVIGASPQAADDLLRRGTVARGAAFGWHRTTLPRLAGAFAEARLVTDGRAMVSPFATEGVVARVAQTLRDEGRLGRYQPVGDGPGFARAVAATLLEVRMAAIDADLLAATAPELATLLRAYEAELAEFQLADRSDAFRLAIQSLQDPEFQHPWADLPPLFLDVPTHSTLEARLVAAVCKRATTAPWIGLPAGDSRSLDRLHAELQQVDVDAEIDDVDVAPTTSLARMQQTLFKGEDREALALESNIEVLSAPGEARECVEIARRLLSLAASGVPFDRMAVVLRSVEEYRPHLEEALARADIPAWFARGTLRPDASGRAFLALLACRSEGLSARRFSEYLSIGEIPEATPDGAPPPEVPSRERAVPPDDDMTPEWLANELAGQQFSEELQSSLLEPEQHPILAGSLRTPRRWERLLVDASVIGGIERWDRRLHGLEEGLKVHRDQLEADEQEGRARGAQADIDAIATLRHFALPLLRDLEALPDAAPWSEWLDHLTRLATRSLRDPERLLTVLAELIPMGKVGPVALPEVRRVLSRKLLELYVRPPRDRMGKVFVAPIDAARGLTFDVVFVPGLAERLFPRAIAEEPILLDTARALIDPDGDRLRRNRDRVAEERLLLHIAIGSATKRLVISYPRLDLDLARPRVPSFYALEAVRAAEGELPSFDALATHAETITEARIGWPAPRRKEDAIDEAEYDLSLLEEFLTLKDGDAAVGVARYLIRANPHLGRALRSRARRWLPNWTAADGLLLVGEGAQAAMARQQLDARSFSPTALQNFAQCPYRFYLYTLLRLAPREVPEAIEEMDPLTRGSLVHDTQFELFTRLKEGALLPVSPENLAQVQSLLDDEILPRVAREYEERLAPAIDKVWSDGIASIRADMREWLRRMTLDRSGFIPWRFELSFGLDVGRDKADPHSTPHPVKLDCGLQLRGSIDLVEKSVDGHVRVTDHKTGKVKVTPSDRIAGGQSLQAVLYALTVEKLFPELKVESGRLHYCTSSGGFEDREVPLDGAARDAADTVAKTIGAGLKRIFLPAAPSERGCMYCDYRVVCGPYEEDRVKRKSQKELTGLTALRKVK